MIFGTKNEELLEASRIGDVEKVKILIDIAKGYLRRLKAQSLV
jgi:hypothetical protein